MLCTVSPADVRALRDEVVGSPAGVDPLDQIDPTTADGCRTLAAVHRILQIAQEH